jgi:hypothetical protein
MSDTTAAHLAIAEAVKESVKTGDEGLLDAAIADYQQLITKLASTHQFSSLKVALDVVSHAVKVNELINLKDTLSTTIFGKVLTITHFQFQGLASKRDATDHRYYQRAPDLPPNAGQSIIIAKAFTVARKDELNDLLTGINYFAKMGHHQALSVLLDHYFQHGMAERDTQGQVFTHLARMKTSNTLHASVIKTLKAHADAFFDCTRLACARLLGERIKPSPSQVFSLPLIEAFYDAGFKRHAQFMATAYIRLLPANGTCEEPCMLHRLRFMGVDTMDFSKKSRQSMSPANVYPASISTAWLEDFLVNADISIDQMTQSLSTFNFTSIRTDSGFKACEAVLDFAKNHAEKYGFDYPEIVDKAAALCNLEIDKRKLGHDQEALKSILNSHQFPSDLIFKVKRFKGAHLENELGL